MLSRRGLPARKTDAKPPNFFFRLGQESAITRVQIDSRMDKILYLTRHAQAYHNVADDYTSPFFPLTRFGSERIAFDSQSRRSTNFRMIY